MDGFRSRVDGNVVAQAQRDPAAFRSGAAEALTDVGRALGDAAAQDRQVSDRLAQLEYQDRARQEQLALSRQLQDARAAFEQRQMEAQAAPPDVLDGYADKAAEDWGTIAQGIVGRATTRDAQDSLVEQSAAIGAGVRRDAQRFEITTRVGRQKDDMNHAGNAFESAMLDYGQGKEVEARLQYTQLAAYGRGLEASVGPDIARRFVRDTTAAMQRRQVEGAIDRGEFGFARNMIGSDDAKATWSPEVRERLTDQLSSAERVQAAAARADAAHALTQQREALATQRAMLETGAGQPSDWADLAKRYEAIGDTSAAVTAGAKAVEMRASLTYRGDTLPQMDQRIGVLNGKRIAGGLSASEASELKGLTDLRGQTATRLNSPGGALAQYEFATGKVVAPLNLSDPASLRTRAAQATAAAAQYGRATIEPLKASEIDGLKDMYANGPNGRLQALDAIRGFGSAPVVAGAARQIAGNDDGEFRIAAQLPRDVARDVLRGGETLKTHGQVWKETTAQSDFDKWFGRTLSLVGGSYRTDIYQAAKAFYAQRASDGGEQKYNPGRFAEAVLTVMGRNGDRGGIARTDKGIVLVPSDLRPADVMRTFARATPQDYARASGGHAPRWADGSVMSRGQFATLQPTMVADGHYAFRDRTGRFVQDDTGQAYTVDLRALGQK